MNGLDVRAEGIYIIGVGAQTPVGRSVPAAAAAVRAGVSAYAEHSSPINKYGEPIIVARAEWLEEARSVPDRTVALALDAAREALNPIAELAKELEHVRVHLALSKENVPELTHRREILRIVRTVLGLPSGDPEKDLAAEGHAGGFVAMENAVRQLRAGEAPFCLVGGADSWLDADRLNKLDRANRLHSTRNSWGFIPGEGAGFCLLATGETVARHGLRVSAELLGVATANEERTMGSEAVCLGEGLTTAFRAVLNPTFKVAQSYCDLNGETYRADEYGFAVCRTGEFFLDASRFTAPAQCWGDVGSASACLHVALATFAFEQEYAKGPVTLVWGSSASLPRRGCALLRQLGPGGPA